MVRNDHLSMAITMILGIICKPGDRDLLKQTWIFRVQVHQMPGKSVIVEWFPFSVNHNERYGTMPIN